MDISAWRNLDVAIASTRDATPFDWGFRCGDRGTHTSRTIMFEELSALLQRVPPHGGRDDYARAITDDNCLGKLTAATRKQSLQRLTELYALDPKVPLFRALALWWQRFDDSRPLLALLLAMARDPLLRASAPAVLATPVGHEFARQMMTDAIRAATNERLNGATLDKVVRNASASWTQSGHLRGRARKTRRNVEATPAATAYAALLGYAVGRRGTGLFDTPWAAVLSARTDELINHAIDAKRLGLLDLRHSGSVLDVSFPLLLTDQERGMAHGPYRQAG